MSYEITSAIVPRSKTKEFREGGRTHHNVRIYLSSDGDSDLDLIDSVQYELHPTFKNRIRVAPNRQSNFEIAIWTWGYFNIKAKLVMKDGPPQFIDGMVRW